MLWTMFFSVVLPVLLSGALLVVAWWPRRAAAWAWLTPAALALGFGAACVAMCGWPEVPPRDRWQWITLVACAGALAGVLASALRAGRRLMPALALLLGAAVAVMIRPPAHDGAPWRVGLGVATAVLVLVMEPVSRRRPGVTLPAHAALLFASVAGVVMAARFATLAIATGAIGAACGVAAVLALANPKLTFARGGTLVLAAFLPAILLIGRAYDEGDVPAAAWILLAAAPLTLLVGEVDVIARRRPPTAAALRLLLLALPCAAALAIAWIPSDADVVKDDRGSIDDSGLQPATP